MLFGDRLRKMREKKGLTRGELGSLIGVFERVESEQLSKKDKVEFFRLITEMYFDVKKS